MYLPSQTVFAEWWMVARKRFDKVNRRCFDSLVVLTIWTIWNEWNRRILDHKERVVDRIIPLIIVEGELGFRVCLIVVPLFVNTLLLSS